MNIGVEVGFIPVSDPGVLVVTPQSDGAVTITHGSPVAAQRGLSLLRGDLRLHGEPRPHRERCRVETLTVMFDVSRNAVLTVEAVIGLLDICAGMGINRVMLYTEDTYLIEAMPWFGHARGGYSLDDLRTMDAAATDLGVELVGCIQTLGHLANAIKWPALARIRDTEAVLLTDHPQTYELIGQMLDTMSAGLGSRTIHLGMDETFGLGGGVHRNRYGLEEPASIFARHLTTVVQMCRDRGLEPMIWSDMILRSGSPDNRPSDLDARFDTELVEKLPPDLKLVHWDYNHNEIDHHRRQLARHRELGQTPTVAGGVHTWRQHWANLPQTWRCLDPLLQAATEADVTDLMLTIWGNGGSEFDWFSALPAVQTFADHAWAADADIEARFAGSVDASFAAWVAASELDLGPGEPVGPSNTSVWVLWLDPVLDHFSVAGLDPQRYERLADRLEAASTTRPGDRRLAGPALLARTVAAKLRVHQRLRDSYHRGDCQQLIDDLIPTARELVRQLAEAHRVRWHEMNRPQGWELVERRYAGLVSRLDTLATLLAQGATIETLDAPQLDPPARHLRHDLVASGSLDQA